MSIKTVFPTCGYLREHLFLARQKLYYCSTRLLSGRFLGRSFIRIMLREIGLVIIRFGSKGHRLIVDVSDLPEDQSADLGLNNCGAIFEFERVVFKNAAKLFVASPG